MTSEICVYCKAKCNCRYFNRACKKFKPSSKDDDNLSSKIHWITGTKDKKLLMVRVEEIQKAVQKLKEVVFNAYPEENTGKCCIKIRDEIDRIFGDFK